MPIDAGNVVPIIQGHGSQRPRSCPWCPSCRSTTGNVVPAVPIDSREAVADHPGPRVATAAVLLPMIDAGKLLPIIQGHGPRLATAAVVPVVPIDAGNVVPPAIDSRECRADHRPGAVPYRACNGRGRARRAESCRSSTLPRSCPTAGSCCRSSTWLRGPGRLPMIDGGKLVPSRARADHPGPRLATVPVVPVVPIDSREGGADHRPGCAVPVVPAVSIIDLAAVLPYGGKLVPVVPVPIDGGKVVPRLDSRERRADHPGPRLATVPVVPVVPIDSREGGADHRPGCAVPVVPAVPIIDLAAVLPYGGKLLPIIDLAARCPSCRPCRSSTLPRSCPTAGSWCPWCPCRSTAGKVVPIIDLAARSGPVADDRRREAGAESCPCRSSRATARNGARGARRADRQPGRWCRSSTWLRGARRAGRVDHRPCRGPALRREAGARGARADRRREGGAAPRQPGTSCRSSRATGGNGRGGVRRAGRAGRVDRRRERRADHRRRERRADHPGPRLATAAVLLPIIDGGNVVPVVPVPIDSREAVADHPGPRVATAAVVPVVPAVPIIDLAAVLPYGGKLLPIIDLAARSGPVADDRRREAGAESCPCRSSRATARNGARGARRADRQPGRWCRSSTWLRGARRAGRADHRPCRGPALRREAVADHRPGSRSCCRSSTAGNVVPALATAAVLLPIIDGGNVVPVVPVPIDAGNVVPIIQGHGWQRPRSCRPCRSSTLPRSCPTAGSWCPWCRSTPGSCCRSSRATACNGRGGARGAGRASTAGKLLPIIQGHGSQRPRWCPSCRSTPGSCCRSSTWLRGPGLLPMIDAGKLLPALATVAVVPAVPIDSRERRADHPGPRVATAAVVPVVPIDAGKLVPIIGLAARSGPVADDRRREGGAAPRQPGTSCRSSRATGGNGRGGARRAGRAGRVDRRRERRADHPGPRLATAAVLLPIIDSRERRAGTCNGRGPVADHRRRERRARGARADRQPGSCCRSSRATGGNGRGGARRAGRADHRPCRGPALRREAVADHRPGCAVRAGCR